MSFWHPSSKSRSKLSRKAVGLGAIATLLACGSVFGQEYTDIRRLGTSNAVFKPGPQTREELQQVFRDHREEYEKVLNDANWPGDHDDLFAAITNGEFSEARYPVGHTFEWMALRRNGVVGISPPIRWAGDAPFEAFEIRFISRGQEHRFLIPKACGNLSLIQMRDAGPPDLDERNTPGPSLNVQSPNTCTGVNVTLDVTLPDGMPEGARLEVSLTRPSGQSATINPSQAGGGYRWEGELDDAGSYTFSATFRRGDQSSRTTTERLSITPCEPTCNIQITPPPMDPTPKRGKASFTVDTCASTARVGSLTSRLAKIFHTPVDGPEQLVETLTLDTECSASYLMPEYGSYRVESEIVDDRGMRATCQADYTLVEPEGGIMPFFTIFAGNERRWRAQTEAATANEEFIHDRSAALLGGTFGIAYPFADQGAQVFGQVGFAANLRDGENSSLFADIGVDKNFEKGFFGGGVGIWDINNSDTTDGTIFLHGGYNLSDNLQLNLEGRLFMDMLNMINNNFMYMGGIRYFFGK